MRYLTRPQLVSLISRAYLSCDRHLCNNAPSHGKPFTGLHTRVQQLLDHHHERLNDIMQASRQQGLSAADILPILFKRQLDTHQMTFAMGEALAHLHYLWFSRQLTRRLDENGILRFYAPNMQK